MKRKPQPIQEHAGSRYMCVTIRVIEVLQGAYLAGRPLGHVVPDIDADTAAVIVAESLEADRIWNLPPEQLLGGIGDGPMSDFKRAVLAEILFEIADVARDMNEEEKAGDWWALAMASLEEALRSPTASPMLWYEDIFYDLAQASRQGEEGDDQEAIYWLKGGLAHNLRHDDGSNALNSLRDLAEVHLSAGELDVGLKMLAALLRHDPSDIWTYNIMAISFDDYGLTELGTEVTRCGLELLDAKGDPNKLRDQLNDCLEQMKASEKHGREAEATPEVLTELRAALALDFDAGQPRPLDALCRELVPDLDEIPVKRPMRPSDIPLPEKPVRSHRITPPDRKPGRNAPCWCGSGKKYKHCHWREDQRQRR